MIDTRNMTCTRCEKHLSRKSARMIDGKLLCSPCMFGPKSEATRSTLTTEAA